ncbi:MAG: AAA family ATPase [Deltaproteobacteria bacterium]|nr:AAA family ATPase [Deltaproteobacteria bacterium]
MTKNAGLKLTDEQEAIIGSTENLLAVTAYAGTGKTSTLKIFAKTHPREKMLYLAFNRSLAADSKEAFRDCPNVQVRTIHSLAYSLVGHKYASALGEIRPYDMEPYCLSARPPVLDDKYLVLKVAHECLHDFFISSSPSMGDFLKKYRKMLVAKLEGMQTRPSSIRYLVEHVWEDSQDGNFAMPHNGYLKLLQMDPCGCLDGFDRILVDEAQDLNDCMISLVTNCSPKKIFVGDPYQQIYGFNGAVNALSKKALKSASPYYLTQSFRCPHDVAELANQYLKLLGAPKDFTSLANHGAGDSGAPKLLIARTNAGLFDFVAKNIEDNKFSYNGGFSSYQFEIILDLVNLILGETGRIRDGFYKNFKKIDNFIDYATKVKDSVALTRIKIAKKYMGEAFDIYMGMKAYMVPESKANQSNYIATTAHKVKGREYDNVVMLDDFASVKDIVSQGKKIAGIDENGEDNPESLKCSVNLEELRLLYVAITRTRRQLAIPKHYRISDSMVWDFKNLTGKGYIEVTDKLPAQR